MEAWWVFEQKIMNFKMSALLNYHEFGSLRTWRPIFFVLCPLEYPPFIPPTINLSSSTNFYITTVSDINKMSFLFSSWPCSYIPRCWQFSFNNNGQIIDLVKYNGHRIECAFRNANWTISRWLISFDDCIFDGLSINKLSSNCIYLGDSPITQNILNWAHLDQNSNQWDQDTVEYFCHIV